MSNQPQRERKLQPGEVASLLVRWIVLGLIRSCVELNGRIILFRLSQIFLEESWQLLLPEEFDIQQELIEMSSERLFINRRGRLLSTRNLDKLLNKDLRLSDIGLDELCDYRRLIWDHDKELYRDVFYLIDRQLDKLL